MKGASLQLECRFEHGIIAKDGNHARWDWCVYLNMHGHTLPSMALLHYKHVGHHRDTMEALRMSCVCWLNWRNAKNRILWYIIQFQHLL